MFTLEVDQFLMIMAASMLALGVITMVSGIIVLVFRASGKDVHTLANHSVKLAQKGVAEEVSGLVGNTSALLEALNQLVKTNTGVGIFLVLISLLLFAGAFFLARGF